MKKLLLVILVVLYAPTLFAATYATKDNITWTFDSDYVTGQFVSGDWYVVAPSGLSVTAIAADGGEVLNGTMVNPQPGETDGLAANINDVADCQYAGYSASNNDGLSLPLSLVVGDFVVTATEYTCRDYLDGNLMITNTNELAILTVVSSTPSATSLRPGLFDPDFTFYDSANFDLTFLPSLTVVGTPPTAADVADLVARPWYDPLESSTASRAVHPANNMPDYGGRIRASVGIAATFLISDYAAAEKLPVAIGFAQIGIDWWGLWKQDPMWKGENYNTAHDGGRKLPIMFAGEVLGIAEIQAIWSKTGDYLHTVQAPSVPTDAYTFQVDAAHHYVTSDDVSTCIDFVSGNVGMPEWFKKSTTNYSENEAGWQWTPYRFLTGGAEWGIGLAAYAMGFAGNEWDNPAWFDYLDRYDAIANGLDDGWVVTDEASGSETAYGSDWSKSMWDAYRDSYTYTTSDTCDGTDANVALCTESECTTYSWYYYNSVCNLTEQVVSTGDTVYVTSGGIYVIPGS